MGAPIDITDEDIRHRKDLAAFAALHAWGYYRDTLQRLYGCWRRWNEEFFFGKMIEPYIMLTDMAGAGTQGDFCPVMSFGGKAQMRLRHSILTGEYPCAKGGSQDPEGLMRVMEDVCLHENCHEILQCPEDSFRGHGPKFLDDCNRISAILGFGRVRAGKKRGLDSELPSCAHWPTNVRPDGFNYYLGAWLEAGVIGAPHVS